MRVAFEHVQLDSETRTLEREGQRVAVEPKVFDLLVYLIEHRERVVSNDELLDGVWPGVSVGPAALSGAVHKARQALGDDGEQQTLLRTVRGHGFQFVADVSEVSVPGSAVSPVARRSRTHRLAAAAIAAVLVAVASIWLLRQPVTEDAPGHTLAVLPFVNMSADPEQAYFADGIAEELLNSAARFDGLRVVGRTSSFSFRDSDADLKTIGETLGADVILEGSVRTDDDRVRITAQLVNTGDGLHRWSEMYDRKLDDIFAIQTEIATAIATALRVELSSDQRQQLAKPPTRNLAAYQAYLLGRQRLARRTAASVEEAIAYFQRALELDPELALAYLGLTEGYVVQHRETGPTGPSLLRAEVAAQKALELDDRLAEAHVALSLVEWWRNNFEAAEAALQRALVLNPNSVDANIAYGELLASDLARYDEALALNRKAVELDPLSIDAISGLGWALECSGRFDESLAAYERTLEIDPDYAWGYGLIALHHHYVSGRLDQTAVWWAKLLARDPADFNVSSLGHLFLELGDADQAEPLIRASVERDPQTFWVNIAAHDLALRRGDDASALDYARKAFSVWPVEFTVPMLLRDRLVAAGRYAEARALFEQWYPELLFEGEPTVDARNYRAAIDLALILSRMGEPERAGLLLDRALQQIQRRPRLGRRGYWIADVQAFALRGERSKALAALRRGIDEGWRVYWSYLLHYKPDLEPLHDDREFQAMVKEIESDMAAQLAHVREMEQSGELVFQVASPEPRLAGALETPPATR